MPDQPGRSTTPCPCCACSPGLDRAGHCPPTCTCWTDGEQAGAFAWHRVDGEWREGWSESPPASTATEQEPVDRRITPDGHATPRELWPDSREAARDD